MTTEFDDIRSFRDNEAKEKSEQLLQYPQVREILKNLLPDFRDEHYQNILNKIESIRDFQHELVYPILQKNILKTFTELTVSGLENLDKKGANLFISNHRDIVLDSALLNYFLHDNGFSTAEIAIGDNLVKDQWIKDLVRLNKSFLVKRGLDNMEMLRASKKMSEYIKDTIVNRNESVWIAQRAGRAKDGNDETNKGLITMFGMSNEGDVKDHYKSLNIIPVSVSYEFDPCDDRKTKELYFEKENGSYTKSEKEDVESMKMGILLSKGKGHIHFGESINKNISGLETGPKKSIFTSGLSNLIDASIQSNYKTWSTNHIALELISGSSETDHYDEKEKNAFLERISSIEENIEGDKKAIREIILKMYAQPLINKRNNKPVSLYS